MCVKIPKLIYVRANILERPNSVELQSAVQLIIGLQVGEGEGVPGGQDPGAAQQFHQQVNRHHHIRLLCIADLLGTFQGILNLEV